MYTIRRTRVRVKHPYYTGRVSTHTEYTLYDESGKRMHTTRNGQILHHVNQYKDLVTKKFDISKDEIEVHPEVKTETKQGWK